MSDTEEYLEVSDISDSETENEVEETYEQIRNQKKEVELKKTLKPRAFEQITCADDYIRNFLLKNEFRKTLEIFNEEWYAKSSTDSLPTDREVPDLLLKEQQSQETIRELTEQVKEEKQKAEKALGTWDKFRKERDFHRMHHNRVVQEKEKVMKDFKNLKKHYSLYEPTIEELRKKYETAMKEKMLSDLEKDRFGAKIAALESQLASLESGPASKKPQTTKSRKKTTPKPEQLSFPQTHPEPKFDYEPAPVESYQLLKTFKGHSNPISAVTFHPRKRIIATASDDCTWKLWTVPAGELIMSGEGHESWISSLDFHPSGAALATGSGDNTVRIWDFTTADCSAILKGHSSSVWDVAHHYQGHALVSCSNDHTSKLWDLETLKCAWTFADHVDSVNSVNFRPFSNTFCTASADKTISLWDPRDKLCAMTFYGHSNACNNASFDMSGQQLASCDADGIVKTWDIRMVTEQHTFEADDMVVHEVSFDRSGTRIAAACEDSAIRIFSTAPDNESDLANEPCVLRGHEDAVQAVKFDPFGKFILSGGSDNSFRVWGADLDE